MIRADQPTCFDDRLKVAVSSKEDGQMQRGKAESNKLVDENRRQFLLQAGINKPNIALVNIRYGEEYSYDSIAVISGNQEAKKLERFTQVASDCIITNQKDVTLFLPIADCVATVIYDPVNNVVALAHLGRHSSVAKLAGKAVKRMKDDFHCNPKDLIVWMSPAIQPPNYTIARAEFANEDPDWNGFCLKNEEGYSLNLQGFNEQLLVRAGVLKANIYRSKVDTATNYDYWSHFTETTVKSQSEPPRFAVALQFA